MKSYFNGEYSLDHWCMNIPDVIDPHFLFLWEKKPSSPVIIAHLNPTDSRGCRAIVKFCDLDHPQKAYNRAFTEKERTELSEATQYLAKIYRQVFPIVQIMELGNNAHHLDSNGQVVLGSETEPYMLHCHIVARGNPETCYIPEVPLGGPDPHDQFDMRGPKVPWVQENILKCSTHLRDIMYNIKSPFIAIGCHLSIK